MKFSEILKSILKHWLLSPSVPKNHMVSNWDMKSVAFLDLYHWSQEAAITIIPAVLAGSKGVLDLMWTLGNVSRHSSFWLFWVLPQPLQLAFSVLPLNCRHYFLLHGLVTLKPYECSSLLQAIIPTALLTVFHSKQSLLFCIFSSKTSYLYCWVPFCSVLAS